MTADLSIFAGNIALLIGLLIALAVGLFVVIAAWTSIKLIIWRTREHRAEAAHRRETLRPDGVPYPPASRGLCDRCGQTFEKVYYLPSGERLCPDDYNATYGQ